MDKLSLLEIKDSDAPNCYLNHTSSEKNSQELINSPMNLSWNATLMSEKTFTLILCYLEVLLCLLVLPKDYLKKWLIRLLLQWKLRFLLLLKGNPQKKTNQKTINCSHVLLEILFYFIFFIFFFLKNSFFSPHRKYSVWIGGSILSSLSTF